MQERECIQDELISRQPPLPEGASNREVVTKFWNAMTECGCAECQPKIANVIARAAEDGKDVMDWQTDLADKLFMAYELALAEKDWNDRADQMRWGHAGA